MGGPLPAPSRQRTIGQLAPRLTRGELSAEDLLDDCLARIAAHDGGGQGLSAIRLLNPSARVRARELDVARARSGAASLGSLHGVPVVIKDNIDIAGQPTTSGALAMATALALADAEQVRRLNRAGAVIVGKTNLSEFSFEIRSRSTLGGDVRNPFNRAVTAGGSSGGAAAAVAAGFALAAVGTDTGGSIRTPAAYNGLVGLRPTHGLIDRRGVAPLAPTTDTVGPLALVVEDIAWLLAAMTDRPRKAWLAIPPQLRPRLAGARIGVARQAFGCDPVIIGSMDAALEAMASAGATIIDPVALPQDVLPTGSAHIVDWEFRPAFDAYLASAFAPGTAPACLAEILAAGAVAPDLRESFERRLAISSLDHPQYQAILAYHRRLRVALTTAMDPLGLDVLVYPTSAVTPDSLENPAGGWAPELAACSGWPALTLPVGRAANGVPIGLEMLGRPYAEPRLLGLADDLESRLGQVYIPDLET